MLLNWDAESSETTVRVVKVHQMGVNLHNFGELHLCGVKLDFQVY